MSCLWKTLVVINRVLSGVCLRYVYVLMHPNPYGERCYDAEQLALELRQLKLELELGEIMAKNPERQQRSQSEGVALGL